MQTDTHVYKCDVVLSKMCVILYINRILLGELNKLHFLVRMNPEPPFPQSISSLAPLSIPFSWHLRAELCPSPTSPRNLVSPNNVWFSRVSGEAGSFMRKRTHCASLSTPSPHGWPSLRAHPLTIWPNPKAPSPKVPLFCQGQSPRKFRLIPPCPYFSPEDASLQL